MTDKPTIARAEWKIGEWMGRDGAPHRAPWQQDPNGTVSLSVVWGDRSMDFPVAVQDHDGCQALVRGPSR
jgi:hypothetical protein